MNVNIAKAAELLGNDRRLTLREILASLNISFERTQHVVTEILQMRHMCVRWVPRNLTEEQIQQRVQVCMNAVQMSETILNFLTSTVTCDESWIHHYDPLSRQQSSVWKHSNSPPPKKFRSSLLAGEVMLPLFFDAHGMILQHWVPCGQTVNGDYYANVLQTHLCGAMRKKRPDLLKKQWFLLQDNARTHIAAVTLAALTEIDGTALKHPPYSPDLAPCDFWAFPTLK